MSGEDSKLPASPMAIMLRSHQLKVEEVPPTIRAIVRCGAGVNNIPVPKVRLRKRVRYVTSVM